MAAVPSPNTSAQCIPSHLGGLGSIFDRVLPMPGPPLGKEMEGLGRRGVKLVGVPWRRKEHLGSTLFP